MRAMMPLPRLTIWRSLLFAFGLTMSLGALPANAASSITVTTTNDELNRDGDCSLREAIQAVNSSTTVDKCRATEGTNRILLRAGTYTLRLAGPPATDGYVSEDDNATGDLDIKHDLQIGRTNTGDVTINGNGLDRVFDVLSGVNAEIADVTITGGQVYFAPGGGIRNSGNLKLEDCTITGNVGSSSEDEKQGGGGIANTGTLHMQRCVISNNTTSTGISAELSGYGGGIWNGPTGTVTLMNVGIRDNVIASGGSLGRAFGGGVANFGVMKITRSVIRGNTANAAEQSPGFGGGIYNGTTGTLTMLSDTVSGNTARYTGGEEDDIGGEGGGIYTEGTAFLSNTTVSGNRASNNTDPASEAVGAYGGGIFNEGPLTLANATISNNDADHGISSPSTGGGIYNQGAGTIVVRNSIIAGNRADVGVDCASTLLSEGYNLIQDVAGCTISGTTTGNLLGVDPLLAPLAANGGQVLSQALLPDSPAIDAANPALPDSGGSTCEPRDIVGTTRPKDGNGDGVAQCDMGAFERRP